MRTTKVLMFGLFVAAAGCAVPVSQGSADVDAVQGGGGVAIRGSGPTGAGGANAGAGASGSGNNGGSSGNDGGAGGGAGGSSSTGGGCNGFESPYYVSSIVPLSAAGDMIRALGTQNAIDLANALDATLSLNSAGVYVGVTIGIQTLVVNDVELELLVNPDEVTPATLAGVEAAFAPAEEFQPPISEIEGQAPSCTLDQFGITAAQPYVAYIFDPCSTCSHGGS